MTLAEYDVVLLPSFAQVEHWRKQHVSNCPEGLFAQAVSTFSAWVADLWELHGDGRAIIDDIQRRIVMQVAFEAVFADENEQVLTQSPGVVKLAAQCVRQAAGTPAFEQAIRDVRAGMLPFGITQREAKLLEGIARYYDLLTQTGLVEFGSAAAYLAKQADSVFPHSITVLLAHAEPLDWQMEHFFEECNRNGERLVVAIQEASGMGGIDVMPQGTSLRLAFPSGRYAQPGLVVDLVREMLIPEHNCGEVEHIPGICSTLHDPVVVIACKDPKTLYEEIESALAEQDVCPCLQARVPFKLTDFGQRFAAIARTLHGDTWLKEDVSDAIQPPFSGFSRRDALGIDSGLRADRLVTLDVCLAQLETASSTFEHLADAACDPEADVLLGMFEQIALSEPNRSDAWRKEQLAAIAAMRSCTSAARCVGAGMDACMQVLEDVNITVSLTGMQHGFGKTGQPRVVVTTHAAAARMGQRSCAMLILCDLTADDYPMADKDDAAQTLFGKLGLYPADTPLSRARRSFTALQNLPADSMVCVQPLNDWEGNPTYPAAVLQELIDAYRNNDPSYEPVDAVDELPSELARNATQRGEELLFANAMAQPISIGQSQEQQVELGGPGDGAPELRRMVAIPRRGFTATGQFSPSPSQVETYFECPYKWFVQKRVATEMLDEGFGSLERGSFAHRVLQEFYKQFIEEGYSKVVPSNLAYARKLMEQTANRIEEEQAAMEAGSGRYVAVTQMEWRQLQDCKRQLVNYLDFEVRFLPQFHPEHLEYTITLEDDVSYAGRPFVGTVDRIDVDGYGNAVIVDYKGSLSQLYEIAGKSPQNPGKVQTRMYARAVERQLGLRVVGALYVCYGKTPSCSGAYDGRILEAPHLPAMKHGRCRCAAEEDQPQDGQDFSQMTFASMLDETERVVANAIDAMESGFVQPDPSTSDACTYCPARNCPKRGA